MSTKMIRYSKIILSTLIPVGAACLRPMGLLFHQSLILGLLIMVIIWWVTGIVSQTAASVVLLCGFLAFSKVLPVVVLSFPLSENFLLISISFLFSQGVMNSGLAERLLEPLLHRFASTVPRLLISMIVCSGITALFVPQSISRTLIVTSLFLSIFSGFRCPEKQAMFYCLAFSLRESS